MKLRRIFPGLSLFSLLISLLATGVVAQAPLEGPQLPARTSFYLIWHGSPAGEARKSNALMSLWDDPDFAPARAAMAAAMIDNKKKPNDKPGLTRDEVAQYATLLDNPFAFGYMPRREGAAAKTPAAKETAPAWNGMFFVYDRSGKEELLSKAVLRMRANDAEIPRVTEVTVAGVKALKFDRKSGTTYWAETGKYAVAAGEASVFEDVLERLAGKSPGGSLGESGAYKEAKPLLAGGLLEFFLQVPQIKNIAGDSDAASPQIRALWNSLKLDSVHVFAGHISLEGARTRLQGGILGDTAEGSLFDIWPAGEKQPVSFGYVTPETVYYSESQINLLGIYNIIKRALTQPGSNMAGLVTTMEGAAQTRIGMTLPEAFALTTGEIATIQSSPSLDPDKRVFFAGIHNKPEALKLIRTILSDQVTSERSEGNVTYLKISLKGNQGTKGVAQWNFYHLAMTPDLLLGASKNETLREVLAQPPATGMTSVPKTLQTARAQFPEKLNGFSFVDLQKLDWPALKERWTATVVKSAADPKSADAQQRVKQVNDWMRDVNPGVFPKHLHSMTAASWKDASGVHFDQWVD
ncbi:MAG TPA: hypothetical protein VJX70_08725 [Candidatus Acidoferrum sp.]|nr:hypothetical protein [Candidatus Acidoferrum sp.]